VRDQKTFLVAGLAVMMFLLAACGGGSETQAANSTSAGPAVLSGEVKVILQMSAFTPSDLTVKAGSTVTWTNRDMLGHSVVADDGSFKSVLLANGQTYSHQFATVGNFPYYCGLHGGPGGTGMSGVVRVVP
jgi:plastocyanin